MQGKLAKKRPVFSFSPASTESSSLSKPTRGWGSCCIEGARAWVGVPGTKEITVRANSNRMTAPTNVVTDCFACIFFVTTSLLQECLSVSVQCSRSEPDSIPRSEPLLLIGRVVGKECSASSDLFLEWILAPVRMPFMGRCARKQAGEIGAGGGVPCHAAYHDPVAASLVAGWDSDKGKAPLSLSTTGPLDLS